MSAGATDDVLLPGVVLADTDLFFYYLRGGRCERQAEAIVQRAVKGGVELKVSSETYDDAISALRADEQPLSVVREFVSDMKSIPHSALPMSAEVAEEALVLYGSRGGRRRLSYFDAFHVSTAKRYSLPILTTDKYIIRHRLALGIDVVDLA